MFCDLTWDPKLVNLQKLYVGGSTRGKGENNEWRNGKGGTSPVVVVKRAALLFARAPKKESKRALQVQLAVCPPPLTNIQHTYNHPLTQQFPFSPSIFLSQFGLWRIFHSLYAVIQISIPTLLQTCWLIHFFVLIFMKRAIELGWKLNRFRRRIGVVETCPSPELRNLSVSSLVFLLRVISG